MLMENMIEGEIMAKAIMHDIEKGKLSFNDEKVQYFLPVVLYFTNYEWLKYVADNTLIEEDAKIVKNFLNMVETIVHTNSEQLEQFDI